VSDAAPFALWPGAGEGQVRGTLLRAHPLLSDGVVDAAGSSAFGRTLTSASAELQRWLERPALVRLGLAGFADLARASRQADFGHTPVHVDVGAGLRIRIPGTPGVLRADVAHGLRDGANALTFGWQF
jgi:outer membrane translocation and assembly module TamA